MLPLILMMAPAAEPTFVVENRCPQTFVVVNRCQAKAAAPCVCGDGCKCPAGECPSKCPTPTAAKKVAGKKLYWCGQECTAEQLAPILQAWPGSTRVETADWIDYRPPMDALEALMARTRPTGPVEITTPDGRTETRTVEGPANTSTAAPAAQRTSTAGALVTLSGRALLPNGDGSYRYADPDPASRVAAPVRSAGAGDHTHTCSRGHTWDHSQDGGSHNCPRCGEHVTVVSGFGPAPRSAPAYQPSYAPRYLPSYSLPTVSGGCSSGGCSNGRCALPR